LYQSYIIVGEGHEVGTVEELRGDIHAFSDPYSNSGYLVTTALLAAKGERPAEFFGRTFFTYGHRNVVRAVAAGLAGSGSVDGYVWEVLRETEPDLTARTRILHKSEWLGFPPVAGPAKPRSAQLEEAITQALLRMDKDPEGRAVLSMLRLDRFEQHGPSVFDAIAQKVALVKALG
ncbi:MAG: phosphonate ABC transporter substrate-binding protein, partial [Alphaproteobacteria bacterium]